MNLLIDTHILLWVLSDDKNSLSKQSVEAIASVDNTCFVSVASLWEIAIKYSLERIEIDMELDDFFDKIPKSGINVLPISPTEVLKVSQLPFHHQDPFDRLIIAQAICNDFTLISKDQFFEKYPISLIWK